MCLRKSILLLSGILIATKIFAVDLGSSFSVEEAWQTDADEFVQKYRASGFRFVSERKDCAFSLKGPWDKTFYGVKIEEARAYFEAGRLSRLEFSLWNKGDSEAIDYAAQLRIVQEVSSALSQEEKMPKTVSFDPSQGYTQRSQSWDKKLPITTLNWAMKKLGGGKFEPEYVKVVMSLKKEARSATDKPQAKSAKSIKGNVVKSDNGDVYISNVPMVDQGRKGYCAAAVAERVLRYYALTVDEHEIAQIAGTSADGGTALDRMEQSVEKIGGRFGLGKITDIDFPKSVKGILKELGEYNKAAKRLNRPIIPPQECYQGRVLMVPMITERQESEVLKAARIKDGSRYKKFQRLIKQNVDAGVPMFWGVILGLYPESGSTPQSRGGHMRLIIGYNESTKEILFSDSWGIGHELKRVKADDAWAMTTSLFHLKTRK